MSTVRRQIELEVPPSDALAAWSRFTRWILTGRQRLACDELACVDAVRAGLVKFESIGGGSRTNVVFSLESDNATGPSRAVVEQNVARDLVVFKDYVERGGDQPGQPARAKKQALAEDEARRKHERLRGNVGSDAATVAFTDHFPT